MTSGGIHFSEHRRLFPGWWVVVAGVVGLMFGFSAFMGVVFGLFMKPLSAAFRWNREQISLALTICTYSVVILSPVVGHLVDRFGIRRVVIPSLISLSLTIASLGWLTRSLLQFYLTFLLIGLVGTGALPVVYTKAVVNWFNRKRGLALGIVMAGFGLSGMVLPPLIEAVIGRFGWRMAYVSFSGTILFITLPVVFFLLHERPEDFGLAADGFAPSQSWQTRRKPPHASGFSFKEALRERPFWLLMAAFPLLGVASIGLITHLMPLLTDRGLGSKRAAFVLSTMGFAVLLGRIVCGHLLDRVPPLIVAFLCLAGMASGTALLAANGGGIAPYTSVMLIGLGIGAEFDFMSYFVGRYFGCRDYGRIYGLIYGVYCLGSGTGPVFMGRVFDLSGSYTAGLWLLSALTMVAAMLFLLLGLSRERAWEQEATAI